MSAVEKSTMETQNAVTGERILVWDFGSQFAQLIARRVREQNVFCEIVRHDISAENVKQHDPTGLIFSGGPSSVYEKGAPKCDPELFQLGLPILGICYGMNLICDHLGSEIKSAACREFGPTQCEIESDDPLFAGFPTTAQVLMSHGDQVQSVSDDFLPLAKTSTCQFAAVKHKTLPVYGLQLSLIHI